MYCTYKEAFYPEDNYIKVTVLFWSYRENDREYY